MTEVGFFRYFFFRLWLVSWKSVILIGNTFNSIVLTSQKNSKFQFTILNIVFQTSSTRIFFYKNSFISISFNRLLIISFKFFKNKLIFLRVSQYSPHNKIPRVKNVAHWSFHSSMFVTHDIQYFMHFLLLLKNMKWSTRVDTLWIYPDLLFSLVVRFAMNRRVIAQKKQNVVDVVSRQSVNWTANKIECFF